MPQFKYTIDNEIPGNIIITGNCVDCNKTKIYSLPADLVYLWRIKGKFIQDVFPNLSDNDREFLISGTCDECFDKLFKLKEGQDE